MPTFVLTYRSVHPYDPSPETGNSWRSWFEGMGDSLVDMGQPVVRGTALGHHDGTTRLGGFSIVRAPDLEAAVAIAESCPEISHGGGVEVGELVEVPAALAAVAAS